MDFVSFERWIDLAPIVTRTPDEYTSDVRALWESIQNFNTPVQKSLFTRFQDWLYSNTPPEVEERWRDNQTALAIMLSNYLHNTDGHFFTYFLSGVPVGIMTLRKHNDSAFIVQHIATHPAVGGAGGSMFEFAFHYAAQNGWAENIQLSPLNHVARAAYNALGFKKAGAYMKLTPGDSDGKWIKVGGNWRLAKYADLQYVAS